MNRNISCPFCKHVQSASQNDSINCEECGADILTDNEVSISKAKVNEARLLEKLKSLVSRGKKAEADELLRKMFQNPLICIDNFNKVKKAKEKFMDWLSKQR